MGLQIDVVHGLICIIVDEMSFRKVPLKVMHEKIAAGCACNVHAPIGMNPLIVLIKRQ